MVRAEIASLRAREFVQAALSLGASDRRIFFRHLLPNASSTIIVAATSLLGQVIVLEATLEFFNLGVPWAIQPTLGNLIGDAQTGSLSEGLGWWTLVTPAGLLIQILVCVNLLGDGLADAFGRREGANRPGEDRPARVSTRRARQSGKTPMHSRRRRNTLSGIDRAIRGSGHRGR